MEVGKSKPGFYPILSDIFDSNEPAHYLLKGHDNGATCFGRLNELSRKKRRECMDTDYLSDVLYRLLGSG
jgi:hypothetical protein